MRTTFLENEIVTFFQILSRGKWVNTLRPRQNGRHFADDTFKPIFLNENIPISIKISLKFVPKVPINNISALVQIMAWRRPGDKPLSEPMMVCLLTHICVTRPQWVNALTQCFVIGALAEWSWTSISHEWNWCAVHLNLAEKELKLRVPCCLFTFQRVPAYKPSPLYLLLLVSTYVSWDIASLHLVS